MSDHGDSETLPGGKTRHSAGTYQMLWDCRFCGTEKLLGLTHRHCPNCGAAQDPEWRYLPAEEDMVAVEDHKFVGADKMCPACGQPNSAASAFCQECGADLGAAKEVAAQDRREIGEGRAESDTRRDVVKDRFDAEMARVGADEDRGRAFFGLRKREWMIFGGIAILALVIVGIVYAVTYRKATAATVVELPWTRTITIQSFEQQPGSGWDETVPGDAYRVSCSQRQRGSEQVKVGERNECQDVPQGDGTFRRECQNVPIYDSKPVYDQWCTYTVDRWVKVRDEEASGSGIEPAPYWPDYTLASGGSGGYGKERKGGTDETYTVVVEDKNGERHACDFDDIDEWMHYPVDTPVTIELYITGGADCGSLAVAK